MPKKSIHRYRKSRYRSEFRTDMRNELIQIWLLRLLVPLEGYKNFLRERDFRDDDVARAVGLGRYIGCYFSEDEEGTEYDPKAILGELRHRWKVAERQGLPISTQTPLARNIARLGEALELSEAEMRIVHFSVLAKQDNVLESTLALLGSLSLNMLERLFAVCLDLEAEAVRHALAEDGTLSRTGILELDLDGTYEFGGKVEVLQGLPDELDRHHEDPLGLFRNNLIPSAAPKLTAEHYAHLACDIAVLRQYLADAIRHRRQGVNVLIHGVPGSGKTEFARMLAALLGLQFYEVAMENAKGFALRGDDRFRGYRLAQSLLARRGDALVLFDEIEDVFLDTGDDPWRKGNKSGTKAWVNRLLEDNPVPAFWLSNNLYVLDQAVIRRFDYVIAMNAPPRSVRARVIDDYLAGLPVSDAWKRRMAEHELLVPAVVERAAKVVRAVKDDIPPHEVEQALSRTLGNTLEALGLPRAPQSLPPMTTDYRLEVLNADCDLGAVREGLRRHRQGRLCLYGPPGTGKTAFGRYLAERLDLPLLVKRASDLLSPWLGMTEQQMAAMFREAADEGAVLLLDEADSFLQDRQGAQRSWEITEVNEMLTQIESFEGVFIASTNLMGSLDPAALRRFDLKIRFDYLKPEQAWILFADTAARIGVEAGEDLKPVLAKLALLTPGDFANVVRQSRLREIASGRDLFERLEAECAAKPEGRHRPIGF